MSVAKPHVAFFNRSYWPDVEATGQLLEDLCCHLCADWDVTVIAGQPNRNPSNQAFQPNGKAVHRGVTIDRLAHSQHPKSSKLGRIANLASFTNQARRWGRHQPAEMKLDVLVSETDPFLLPIVTAPIAKRFGTRFVVYVQDIYPDIAVALKVIREGLMSRAIRARLRKAYSMADRIVVLDEDMRDRLIGWGIDRDKFVVVPNWVDPEKIHPQKQANRFRQDFDLEDRFVVMHSGNMGMSQRLERLIDASCHPDWPTKAIVALVGDGARRAALQRYATDQRAAHVRFFDYQPREQLSDSLSAADLHVISMDANIRGCLAPSKLYGILATGTPILAIVPPDSAITKEIAANRVGHSVSTDDPLDTIEYIQWCMSHPRELADTSARARQLAIETYSKDMCCRRFATVLWDVMNASRESARD